MIIAYLGGRYFSTERNDWDKEISDALSETECIQANTPDFGNTSYNGPMIDTHYHIPHLSDDPLFPGGFGPESTPILGRNVKISDIVCTMEQEGTTKVFGFFSVFPGVEEPFLKVTNEIMEKYPDKFVPFIMPPDDDGNINGSPTVSAEVLEEMLSVYPNLFKGYGEIGLYEREGGARNLPPDSPRLKEIYPVVRKNKMLVYLHLGEGHQESFEKALEQNPDINFIWHGDQLINDSGGKQDLSKVEEILYRHPNAYYGVDELYGNVWILKPGTSKKDFLAHFEDYESLLEYDVSIWKGFIERHPDQVLWGTDRGASSGWSVNPDVGMTLTGYARAFIGKLSPEVQEKFAYKNAEKLIQ